MVTVIRRRPLKPDEQLPEDDDLVELDARLTLAGITCEHQGDHLGVGGIKRWGCGDKRPVRVWYDGEGWLANDEPIETYDDILSLLKGSHK